MASLGGGRRDAGEGGAGAALAFLDAQKAAHPGLAEWYSEIGELYQRKLWHQLTLKLEQFLALATLQAGAGAGAGGSGEGGNVLIALYRNFISELETRINMLKLAHFAVIVSRQYADLTAATAFLESVIAKLRGSAGGAGAGSSGAGSSSSLAVSKAAQVALAAEGGRRRVEEAVVYVSMQMAALKLQAGEQRECKRLLDQARASLHSLQGTGLGPTSSLAASAHGKDDTDLDAEPASAPSPSSATVVGPGGARVPAAAAVVVAAGAGGDLEVDPSVQASVFWVQSQYCKSRQDYAEFYRSALLYLAYVSTHTLTAPFKLDLAVDLSLAALLGESVYNFGELLAHPIVGVLEGSAFDWLLRMLEVFERGDLTGYEELCTRFAEQLNAQPALVANHKQLREKITILCLMDLVFSRPAEERKIPLKDIAARTHLPLEGVEHLLMKTLSAHLVEGVIDGVDGSVQVSWVQPRVLGIPQVAALRTRLDTWLDRVHSTLLSVEAETPDLLVA